MSDLGLNLSALIQESGMCVNFVIISISRLQRNQFLDSN